MKPRERKDRMELAANGRFKKFGDYLNLRQCSEVEAVQPENYSLRGGGHVFKLTWRYGPVCPSAEVRNYLSNRKSSVTDTIATHNDLALA